MQFVNKRAAPIQVMWVDFEGVEKKYVVVQPGKSATLSTFVNHVWLVRDRSPEGKVLGTLRVRARGVPISPPLPAVFGGRSGSWCERRVRPSGVSGGATRPADGWCGGAFSRCCPTQVREPLSQGDTHVLRVEVAE